MNRALLCTLLVASCAAPTWATRAKDFADRGQCDAARRSVTSGTQDLESRAAFFGGIYADCDRNRTEAVRWFTLAARYGNEPSRNALVKLGVPIPSPDLREASQGAGVTICTQIFTDTSACF